MRVHIFKSKRCIESYGSETNHSDKCITSLQGSISLMWPFLNLYKVCTAQHTYTVFTPGINMIPDRYPVKQEQSAQMLKPLPVVVWLSDLKSKMQFLFSPLFIQGNININDTASTDQISFGGIFVNTVSEFYATLLFFPWQKLNLL